ncbi:hypothetical protein E3J62_05300 [candidate division TA06 bacterium]|uniref:Uncharacterized protein n=1 Tax=candidate division TA06 bacterium TaxID=2250710 RepID=A0A523UUX9_UNCT6|nr:MAG: hypothetical protein E3J62_05300 [candidate division TA06 bacterium]
MAQQDDINLAYYFVFFADVLGQRQRLRDLRELPTSSQDEEKVISILRDTAGFLPHLRKWYQSYLDAWQSESSLVVELDEPVRTAMREARRIEVDYRYFSDCIVIAVCLLDDGHENCRPMSGVTAALVAACGMHVLCLCARKAIRGGVDVGLAIPLEDGEIYGPAVVRAVHLESEFAGYPRIVVGNELKHYLHVVANQKANTPFGQVARKLAISCERMFFTDCDGRTALDFLGSEFKEYGVRPILDELLPKAYGFVRSEQERWRSAGNTKLASRYDSLWSYFESRADVWGIDVQQFEDALDSSSD